MPGDARAERGPACGCAPPRASTWWCRAAITGETGLILRTATSVLFVIPWGGTGSSAPPTPTGGWTGPTRPPRARHRLPARPRQRRARPAADHRRHRGRLRRAAAAAGRRGRRHVQAVPRARGREPMPGAAAGRRRQVHDVPGDGRRRGRPGGAPARTRGQPPAASRTPMPLLGADGYHALWDRAGAWPAGTAWRSARWSTCWSGTAPSPRPAGPDRRRPDAGLPAGRAPEIPGRRGRLRGTAEGALHLEDVLTRRTRISFETSHRGVAAAPTPPTLMGAVLGWDAAQRAREVEHYLARVEAERRVAATAGRRHRRRGPAGRSGRRTGVARRRGHRRPRQLTNGARPQPLVCRSSATRRGLAAGHRHVIGVPQPGRRAVGGVGVVVDAGRRAAAGLRDEHDVRRGAEPADREVARRVADRRADRERAVPCAGLDDAALDRVAGCCRAADRR